MPSYDFHQLSPYDLEILTRDLLQAHWQVTIESFKSGRDAGIDLRYAAGPEKIIVQVKHYLKTGFDGLLRELRKEVEKIQRLRPSRYVLVTSLPLSALNKETIVEIIGGEFLKSHDVLGQEDLNNLLGQHSNIEGQHYKLWLASRAVLDRVLHNAAITRSEFKAQQVYEEARRYVPSSAYLEAQQMLSEQRVVIIAGPPGVGKSTLANLLLYQHLEKNFQAVLMQRGVVEGEEVFQKGKAQVFYFDDFLGATFLGDHSAALDSTNGRELLNFIAMVRATPTSRLILTTREHIYSQAKDRSEKLRHSDIDDLRVVLRMPSYSFAQKARILYNHLYFSDLPKEYRDELLRGEFYFQIIKHEKFNPRLIEWLSSFRRVRNIPILNYRPFIENLLHDPSEIWRHAYDQEISDAGRSLLLAIFSLGGKAEGSLLRSSFVNIHAVRTARYGFQTRPEDFQSALRTLAGAFVKPLNERSFGVIDPSVLDLLNAVIRSVPENAIDIVAGATRFDQIEHIWSFAKADKSEPIMSVFRQEAVRLSELIRVRMLDNRRVDLGDKSFAYFGPTFEQRLLIVIQMLEYIRHPIFLELIKALYDRLEQEWKTERPDIATCTRLLQALERTKNLPASEQLRLSAAVMQATLEEASTGCSSGELRELLDVVDTSEKDSPAVVAARSGFDEYRQSFFKDELRECRSSDEFDGLIGDIESISDELEVDVSSLIAQIYEAKIEFEERENEESFDMEDEWKDRWRENQATERGVVDMFGSLKSEN